MTTPQKPDPRDPRDHRDAHEHPEHHDAKAAATKPLAPAAPGARDTAPVTPAPSATGLLPSSAAIGDPSFMVRVVGSGFDADSVIVFAGQDEPTTYVSDTEVTTAVNMAVWLGPDPAIPVLVRNHDGQTSNTLLFAFTPPREVPLDPAHASKPVPYIEQI